VGRDSTWEEAHTKAERFNPRARVGRDSFFAYQLNVWSRFNPRARVGRDRTKAPEIWELVVSIHAPAWGATAPSLSPGPTVACFNPRARVGRDMVERFILMRRQGFNPRARVGRDPVR